jgi:hypothetical protein
MTRVGRLGVLLPLPRCSWTSTVDDGRGMLGLGVTRGLVGGARPRPRTLPCSVVVVAVIVTHHVVFPVGKNVRADSAVILWHPSMFLSAMPRHAIATIESQVAVRTGHRSQGGRGGWLARLGGAWMTFCKYNQHTSQRKVISSKLC